MLVPFWVPVSGCCCCSITKSCLTLWPHGLQHARIPCPSLPPKVSPCWWCHVKPLCPVCRPSFISHREGINGSKELPSAVWPLLLSWALTSRELGFLKSTFSSRLFLWSSISQPLKLHWCLLINTAISQFLATLKFQNKWDQYCA